MHLRAVSQADLPDFAATLDTAMRFDEVMVLTAPYQAQYPISRYRYVLARATRRFYNGQFLFLIVSDPDDSSWSGTVDEIILGYACYSTTVKDVVKPCPSGWLGNAFERWALEAYFKYSSLFRVDRSSDINAEAYFRSLCETDMFGEYFASLSDSHKEVKGSQHWELELLGVLPEYRRRGVGKTGLSWGFEKARADSVPLVLLSSITGQRLYESVGFKPVKNISILPPEGQAAGMMGNMLKERFEHEDFGLGVGNGLSWNAMVWEPENMRV